MQLKKILAGVVAVVVMGAGMVSAQAVITNNLLTGANEVKGEITLSYNVSLTATMNITNSDLSEAGLNVTPTENMQGNAGIVHVVTNYPNWDLQIDFENGGIPTMTDPSDWTPIKLKRIAADGTALEDATLAVVIALRPAGGGAGPQRGFVNVTPSSTAIYLAPTLAAVSNSSFTGPIDTRSKADIASNGFAPTNATGLHFAINAGIGTIQDNGQNRAAGNQNGEYTETITFTMMASF